MNPEHRRGRLMGNRCMGKVFRDAVVALEQAGHRVCILHGYGDYPDHIRSDIDAISEDATQIPRILSRHETVAVVQAIHTQPTAALWYVLHKWCGDKPVFVRLHVFYRDYRLNGRVFFKGEEFVESCRKFKFFKVPPPALEFAAYLVKKAAKGSLDEIQGERLSELYSEDSTGCRQYLARLLPEAEAKGVAGAAQSGDWEAVRNQIEHLYREMIGKVDRKQPLKVLRNQLHDNSERIRRAVQPPGLLVAFLGVDGAGKSTVMANVERDLAPAFWSTKQYHGRALDSPLRWTKRVRVARQLREQEVERAATNPHALPPARNPHNKSPRRLTLSLIKLGLWWADYTFLGYLVDIYPRLRRSTLVLFDRYYQDLLVDPKRHRYGGPLWLARLVSRFFPRPDVIVLLDAPPEVLHSRKREVPLEETARQREAFLELVRKSRSGHVVDASRPVHEVVAEAEQIIIEHLAARTMRRLKL